MKRMIVFDGYPWDVFGRIYADVRHRGHEKGWLGALKFLPQRCFWSDVVHYEQLKIFKRSLSVAKVPPALPNGITFRLATQPDTSNYVQLFKHPSNINDHIRMFETGDMTMLALDGENLVGIVLGSVWQDRVRPTETDFVIINRAFILNTGKDALIHRLYVNPDYRGRGIGGHLLDQLSQTLHDKGVQQTYSVVNIDGPDALHVFARHGGEVIGDMISLQLINIQFIRLSTSAHSEQHDGST